MIRNVAERLLSPMTSPMPRNGRRFSGRMRDAFILPKGADPSIHVQWHFFLLSFDALGAVSAHSRCVVEKYARGSTVASDTFRCFFHFRNYHPRSLSISRRGSFYWREHNQYLLLLFLKATNPSRKKLSSKFIQKFAKPSRIATDSLREE